MAETALAKIDVAKRALAEAQDLSDILEIRDQAGAVHAYAVAKGARQAAQYAKEVELRAERKAGAFLAAMKDAGEIVAHRPAEVSQGVTLPELGIERIQSSRWQTMAQVPEEQFEAWLAESLQEDKDITQVGLIRLATGRHTSDDTYEWYTPAEYIEAARRVMGGIDLDPASTEEANKVVKADEFYTAEQDAFGSDPWMGRVWLNPPYNMPLVERFVLTLLSSWQEKYVSQAVLLTNNATDTTWFHALVPHATFCFTKGRIHFLTPGGEPGLATRQGQVFSYLGENGADFVREFSQFGAIMRSVE